MYTFEKGCKKQYLFTCLVRRLSCCIYHRIWYTEYYLSPIVNRATLNIKDKKHIHAIMQEHWLQIYTETWISGIRLNDQVSKYIIYRLYLQEICTTRIVATIWHCTLCRQNKG